MFVKNLIEYLLPYHDKNCNLDHDHSCLDISIKSDKKCIEAMIKNYIYFITVNKSKKFINDLSLNEDNLNINKQDFLKVTDFVSNYDNYIVNNNKNDNIYYEKCSEMIKNKKFLKNKPVFLIAKKQKRINDNTIKIHNNKNEKNNLKKCLFKLNL
jgi:hypothetical protein